jgi:hypothetical protein
MSNEIKVGDLTLTPEAIDQLERHRNYAGWLRSQICKQAKKCCLQFRIDPETDSVAKDICEEIVLHGTPVDEVIAKLQRHLEATR